MVRLRVNTVLGHFTHAIVKLLLSGQFLWNYLVTTLYLNNYNLYYVDSSCRVTMQVVVHGYYVVTQIGFVYKL